MLVSRSDEDTVPTDSNLTGVTLKNLREETIHGCNLLELYLKLYQGRCLEMVYELKDFFLMI
jgi:hypothetical protein